MINVSMVNDRVSVNMISEDGTNYLQMNVNGDIRGSFIKIYNDDISFGENCNLPDFANAMFNYIVKKLKIELKNLVASESNIDIDKIKYIDINVMKDNVNFKLLEKAIRKSEFETIKNNTNSITYRCYLNNIKDKNSKRG